jgi:hypothetical protein
LNPSVYSVGKFVWIKFTSSRRCNFQKKFHVVGDAAGIYRWYIPTELFRLYIPAESPMEKFRRRMPTEFEMELFPSAIFTDGKFLSVILLVLFDFLVVIFPRYIPRELQWEK